MKLKAKDSFYSDDTKLVAGGSTFEVETVERAKELIDRGLAEPVTDAAPKAATKRRRKAL